MRHKSRLFIQRCTPLYHVKDIYAVRKRHPNIRGARALYDRSEVSGIYGLWVAVFVGILSMIRRGFFHVHRSWSRAFSTSSAISLDNVGVANTRIEMDSLNSGAKEAEYAVRGAIVSRSLELQEQLQNDPSSLPFDKIVACNIGNPHALNQKPISFARDVISLVVNRDLLERDAGFPSDVIGRAKHYLANMPSVGAYSESKGLKVVREEVADFLERRDGHKSDIENIFITNGASAAVELFMKTVLRDPASGIKDGILAPIPQYPIYSALSTLLNGSLVPYYLDEGCNWALTKSELIRAFDDAQDSGVTIRGLVIINPGNPTGQVLSRKDMEDIVNVCRERNICIMADEVYQENVYKEGTEFISFRKVAFDLNAFTEDDSVKPLQLVSFHSTSKGFLGECGMRGGFMELQGFSDDVVGVLYKMASLSLCSNTVGQIATGLMVNPPQEGDPSFKKYKDEKDDILSSMKRRAVNLSKALAELQGVSCNPADGAMYAFPQIRLSKKAIEEAKSHNMEADAFYCMELLNSTGIVLVPGSGFGQVSGTLHFRITILPPEDELDDVIDKLKTFHNEFLAKYGS